MPGRMLPSPSDDQRMRELDALIRASKTELHRIYRRAEGIRPVARRIISQAAKREGVLPSALRQRYCIGRAARARLAVILELRYDRQWPLSEIASALGLCHQTVRYQLRKGETTCPTNTIANA